MTPDDSVALIVFTDGRTNLLRKTIASFNEQVQGNVTERWIYDDSGNDKVRDGIRKNHPDFQLIESGTGTREGFAGAVRLGWGALRNFSDAKYVFHLEDDFLFNRPIILADMINILDKRSSLAQVSLMRQAWSSAEKEAGGVIAQNPHDFALHLDEEDREWLEQSLYFTTNPSLYHRSLIERFDWPDMEGSEGRFTIRVREVGYNFGVMGDRDDEPWVTHIGNTRAGASY
jgi:hypothetical protein